MLLLTGKHACSQENMLLSAENIMADVNKTVVTRDNLALPMVCEMVGEYRSLTKFWLPAKSRHILCTPKPKNIHAVLLGCL